MSSFPLNFIPNNEYYFKKLFRSSKDLDMNAVFLKFWHNDDFTNTIAVWDEMQDHFYRSHVYEKIKGKAASHRSILSSFMPKSGGTFLFNRMVNQFDYTNFFWGVTHRHNAAITYAAPQSLAHYMRGGCFGHSHFLPSPHNLKVIHDIGISKLWIHVRDPREAVVSAYYHMKGEGQGNGEIAEMRKKQILIDNSAAGVDVKSTEIDEFVNSIIHFFTDWLVSWLEVRQSDPNFVYLTFHSQLKRPEMLFSDIFKEFDININVDKVHNIRPDDRFREKAAHWEYVLKKQTVCYINNIVNEKLIKTNLIKSFHDEI